MIKTEDAKQLGKPTGCYVGMAAKVRSAGQWQLVLYSERALTTLVRGEKGTLGHAAIDM